MSEIGASVSLVPTEDNINAVIAALEKADLSLTERVLASLEVAFGSNTAKRDSLRRCRTLISGAVDSSQIAVERADQLSAVRVPLGTASADGSCVLGRDGYIFLTEGSNYVLSRYDRDPESTADLATRWSALFDDRARRQRNAGRQFLQFIVPEKISAIFEHLPFSLRTPTDLLVLLDAHLSSPAWAALTVPTLDLFRIAGPRSFPRLDSHPSAYGNVLIADHVAKLFGYRGLSGLPFSKRLVRSGDLAYRFFGTPLYEETEHPTFDNHPFLLAEPVAIEATNPPGGGHLGSRYVWRNKSAPIERCVVAFANSCFERGGFPALSWWFARLFQEFHFVWSNTVDDEYSEQIGADLVIGQTMERFLFVFEVPPL